MLHLGHKYFFCCGGSGSEKDLNMFVSPSEDVNPEVCNDVEGLLVSAVVKSERVSEVVLSEW
jgi:hypothetical protein